MKDLKELIPLSKLIKEDKVKLIIASLFIFIAELSEICTGYLNGAAVEAISNLKIKEAKALLRSKKMSITEISERLGYESVHYFCRSFKKQTGLSPTEYYKMIRSKLDL